MTTPSGIPVLGNLRWGTHFCHFYETPQDLADCLVPYLLAGLAHGEQCLWVTAEPVGVEDAGQAVRRALPHFEELVEDGQIEILDQGAWSRWLGKGGAEAVLDGWLRKEEQALERGYAGLRLTGNAFWLEVEDRSGGAGYKALVQAGLRNRRVIALCSYRLGNCDPAGVLDVVRNHQFALARRDRRWEIVESASLAAARDELRRSNQELGHRVRQRTAELSQALLEREASIRGIHHQVKNNFQVTASLLQITARRSQQPEVREAFEQALYRLRAMALVHEMLDQEGEPGIDFGRYLRTLCTRLSEFYGAQGRIEVVVESADAILDPNAAVSAGLIVNELVTNALKHAFPGSRRGRIGVLLAEANGQLTLEVHDDGVGLPKAAQAPDAEGAGLNLVRGLAHQLGADLRIESDRGSRMTLVLPGREGEASAAGSARRQA